MKRLTDEEIKLELVDYATEVCTSNPIKEWNHTEMIRRIAQAQLDQDKADAEKEKAEVVREAREKIINGLELCLNKVENTQPGMSLPKSSNS